MLTLIVISLMGDGKEVLEKAFASNGHKNCGYHLNNMQYVFAMLLAYWSWLKKYKYWHIGDTNAQQQAEWAIRKMLEQLIKLWPVAKGMVGVNPRSMSSCIYLEISNGMVCYKRVIVSQLSTITWK